MSRVCVLALFPFVALLGCDDVPPLTFAIGDSGASDGASKDAASNVADVQAGTDSPLLADAPASLDAGCPVNPPGGASACCGPIPCDGDCDAHCPECESKCSLSQVCCAKNSVSCHAASFVCN